jgi:hypothetical protein
MKSGMAQGKKKKAKSGGKGCASLNSEARKP